MGFFFLPMTHWITDDPQYDENAAASFPFISVWVMVMIFRRQITHTRRTQRNKVHSEKLYFNQAPNNKYIYLFDIVVCR